MPDPKEPRYPIYLPPPQQLSSSVPLPRGPLASKRTHRHILPSAPLRSPGVGSPRHASERTPLLLPSKPLQLPSIPQRQPLVIKPQQPRRPPIAPQPEVVLKKKPFYRPRPLWLVPFAIVAALVRGMTLAPRVEVYTQLACYSLRPSDPPNLNIVEWDASSAISLYSSLDPLGPHLLPASPDPRTLPSHHCLTDPAVQASAARLQTLMTITMGLLSALTTTFWGRFSQSHGRTKVLAISTFGLFFTDLVFILTSTPSLPWPFSSISYSNAAWDRNKHHLLLIGPVVEGLLGGWSTLQSATSAYISDCTSVGSRAGVFSRFTGVFYVGFSVGPMIAGWLVRHPGFLSTFSSVPSRPQVQSVTAVFWVAIICNLVNFLLALFVFPESLDKQRNAVDLKGKGRDPQQMVVSSLSPVILTGVEDVEGIGGGDAFVDVEELRSPISPPAKSFRPSIRIDRVSPSPSPSPRLSEPVPSSGFLFGLLRPLSVFLPVFVDMPTRNGLTVKRRRDWSLTLLALGLAAWMLSTGVYQIKYLYAEHAYGWGANELSSYISWMGAVRAVVLLGGIPWVIEKWKPKPGSKKDSSHSGQEGTEDHDEEELGGNRLTPTRLELGKSIRFDLRLARASLFLDLLSNILIVATPSPSFHASIRLYFSGRGYGPNDKFKKQYPPPAMINSAQSQALFVMASTLSAFGGGLIPAVHSLALCIIQARGLEADFGINGYGLRDVDVPEDGQREESESVQGYGAMGNWNRESSVASSAFANSAGTTQQARPASAATAPPAPVVDSGTLFGAFAVLQALGQMILGPMLFGLTYSATVSRYPKTVFFLSSGLLLVAMILMLVVKNPVGEVRLDRREKRFRKRMMKETARMEFVKAKKVKATPGAATTATAAVTGGSGSVAIKARKVKRWEEDFERRGRSVASKDLRGGAVPHGSWKDEEREGSLITRSF